LWDKQKEHANFMGKMTGVMEYIVAKIISVIVETVILINSSVLPRVKSIHTTQIMTIMETMTMILSTLTRKKSKKYS
jgi:hypothetical protein